MEIGNKLYLVGIKQTLPKLANCVSLIGTLTGRYELGYFNFWNNICFIEYNQDTKEYTVKEFNQYGESVSYKIFHTESMLFAYMDQQEILFVDDCNPLGAIFQSYAMAYLAVVRWAADVAYTRELWNKLVQE